MKNFKYSKIKSYFDFIKNKNVADSGLIITFGDRGSGKSASCAKIYYQWLKGRTKKNFYSQYQHIYSNIEFKCADDNYHYLDLPNFKFIDYFPNTDIYKKYNCSSEVLTPFKIESNSLIILDELGIIAHNRNYKSFPPEFINFLKIIRKNGILILGNSQQYDIDKVLRNSASELRIQRKFGKLSYSRKLNKWIDINTGDDSNAEQQIVDKIGFASIFQQNAIKLCYIPFYSNLYNSFN